MWLRRAFYFAQFAAVVALPGWIVVARAIAPSSLGAQDIIVFLSWPLLAVALAAVLGITWGRKAVRTTRTVSWLDVAVLSSWYAVAIAYGAFIAAASRLGSGLLGGVLVIVSLAAFWSAIWQLIRAARRAVETVFASLDRSAVPAGEYRATRLARGDGDVIRIDPSDEGATRR